MNKMLNKAWGIAAMCCLFLVSCMGPKPTPPTAGYPVMKVGTADRSLESNYSASIQGRQDINIFPQVSGVITKLAVNEGEKVRKGQILFVIDQVPFKAALLTAEANFKASQAGLATAYLVYKSKKDLYKEKVISRYDMQLAENNHLTAKAQVAQTEAMLVNAKNNLSYTEVKSPSDGVVGKLPFRVGTLVSPSIPTPLTTVSDNSTMYVYFSMNESQVLKLVRQYASLDSALAKMPLVQLKLSDGSTYEEKGKIESISGVIDKTTGTVSLRAAFPNSKRLLLSGGAGTISIPSVRKNCLIVPQTATFSIQDKIYVYKVVDGKAKSFIIDVLPLNNGREYIVESGVKEGDEIIASGAGLIREGMPVKPIRK